MASRRASTNTAFFQKRDFVFDPHASLYTEFYRLANSRQWKQGSKKKTFEKAWYECFGPGVPVGEKINEVADRNGAQPKTEEDVFSSMLHGLINLGLGTRTVNRGMKRKDVESNFRTHYGVDASVLGTWQALCRDCGLDPPPSSITTCKKV